jgi:signal transduction histidine kinase
MPIDLDLDAGELPDAVCTTAYFVASEAVTNAVKYAAANRIALRVSQDEAAVHVEISDDGQGGASIRPGGGLAGLVDRVHALGGVLHVVSPHGGGTLVEAVLPCAS